MTAIEPDKLFTTFEEVFFMLRGKIRLVLEQDGEKYETELHERDLVFSGRRPRPETPRQL